MGVKQQFFSIWSSPDAHTPEYLSPTDLRLWYMYFNPPMTQPDLIHIDMMGGDTVQPAETTIATTFLQEFVKGSPSSSLKVLMCYNFSFINKRKILEYRLYWDLTWRSEVFFTNSSGYVNKHRDNSNTGQICGS